MHSVDAVFYRLQVCTNTSGRHCNHCHTWMCGLARCMVTIEASSHYLLSLSSSLWLKRSRKNFSILLGCLSFLYFGFHCSLVVDFLHVFRVIWLFSWNCLIYFMCYPGPFSF